MLPINLNFIQNQKNYKKKGIDDICGTSYQKNYKKKELKIYVALATKPEKLQKIFMLLYIYPCYPCTFRYCTNGRGSVPSLISKEHLPTSAAHS